MLLGENCNEKLKYIKIAWKKKAGKDHLILIPELALGTILQESMQIVLPRDVQCGSSHSGNENSAAKVD